MNIIIYTFYEFLIECLSFSWYVGASLLNAFFPLKDSLDSPKKQPIIFVHGLGAQPLVYLFLKKFLEKRNFSVYFFRINLFKSLGFGIRSIDEIAREIDSYIQKKELRQVVLVGVSAGAIPSLVYLEQYGGWKKIKHFIALTPAFRGGWLSYVFPFFPISSYYKPTNNLDYQLFPKQLRYPEKITSLFGKWDEFVSASSSHLEGVKNIQLSEGGHAYVQTFSKKTFAIIANEANG